MVLVVFVNK